MSASSDRRTVRRDDVEALFPGQRAERSRNGHEILPQTSEAGSERRGRGPGRAGLEELEGLLSPRDHAVIELVADHRFLTTKQIEQFCFFDHKTHTSAARSARRVLARLCELQVLDRVERRVGGLAGGSESSIWRLSPLGLRLRALRRGLGTSPRVRTPGERFIAHHLAVAELHLELVKAERRGLLLVSRLSLEPHCWRQFNGLGGIETLKPDMAVVVTPRSAAEFEDHYFIEVDRATESLPTVLRQCQQYEAYRRTGDAQASDGVFPIVLWVVPNQRRAEQVAEAIERSRSLDAANYRVVMPDEFIDLLVRGPE